LCRREPIGRFAGSKAPFRERAATLIPDLVGNAQSIDKNRCDMSTNCGSIAIENV
jgi:hypothetical protein